MTQITLHSPAPTQLKTQLHDNLVASGQTLGDHQMETFLLEISAEDGTLLAGLKGEHALGTAHVSELWVAADARRQGYGTQLLRDADSLARDQGCTRIHIETRNPKAQALYARHGYVLFGELPHYDGPNSLVYMVKAL